MNQSSQRVIVGLSVVLLAGCSGLATSGSSPTATSPAGEYPPGTTADSVAEPFTLAGAHADALDASYTVDQRYEISYANGSTRLDRTSTVAVGDDGTEYLWNRTVSGTNPGFFGADSGTIIHYSNGSIVARAITYGEGHPSAGTTEYEVVYDPDGSRAAPWTVFHGTPRNDERIAVLFGDLSNVSVTREDTTTYRVRATSLADDTIEVAGERNTNVSAVEFAATVTPDGLVRAYELKLRGTLDGQEVTATERIRYSDLGRTTVEEPGWYDDVVANSTAPPS
jgi:hypothetical protein